MQIPFGVYDKMQIDQKTRLNKRCHEFFAYLPQCAGKSRGELADFLAGCVRNWLPMLLQEVEDKTTTSWHDEIETKAERLNALLKVVAKSEDPELHQAWLEYSENELKWREKDYWPEKIAKEEAEAASA